MRRQRLDINRFEEASAGEIRQATRIIDATDFPNARRAHALLPCRFSRQSLEVGDHVKLLCRVTERYVRHECARDRVRWICDPGAQIVLRPGQPGLLQGIGIRKSRYGCGGSPDNASEARTEGTRAHLLCVTDSTTVDKNLLTGNLHSLPDVEVRKKLSKCSSRNQPNSRCYRKQVDALHRGFLRSPPDNANSKTCRNDAFTRP